MEDHSKSSPAETEQAASEVVANQAQAASASIPEVESPPPEDLLAELPSKEQVIEEAQTVDEVIKGQPSVDELLGHKPD